MRRSRPTAAPAAVARTAVTHKVPLPTSHLPQRFPKICQSISMSTCKRRTHGRTGTVRWRAKYNTLIDRSMAMGRKLQYWLFRECEREGNVFDRRWRCIDAIHHGWPPHEWFEGKEKLAERTNCTHHVEFELSLIHISEPTRPY